MSLQLVIAELKVTQRMISKPLYEGDGTLGAAARGLLFERQKLVSDALKALNKLEAAGWPWPY